MAATPEPHRDSHGQTLEDYPRPSAAVDTAVLTVPDRAGLRVLLTRTNDSLRTGVPECCPPGTLLHRGETWSDAVLRALREKAGVTGGSPRSHTCGCGRNETPLGLLFQVGGGA